MIIRNKARIRYYNIKVPQFIFANLICFLKERGRVNVRDIRVVEAVTIKDRGSNGSKHDDKKYANSFQVGYRTQSSNTKNSQHNSSPEFHLIVVAR